MATTVWLLTLILWKELSVGSSLEQCTASTDISMSAGFLPAALAAITPLGYGSCKGNNGTCSTPPAACPSSSCCISREDPSKRTCGCLITSRNGTQTCSDPRTLALDMTTCMADGESIQTKLQFSLLSLGSECAESVQLNQVATSEVSIRIHVTATTCFRQRNKGAVLPPLVEGVTALLEMSLKNLPQRRVS